MSNPLRPPDDPMQKAMKAYDDQMNLAFNVIRCTPRLLS